MQSLLYRTLSSDDDERSIAVGLLQQFEREHYSLYSKSMCEVLSCSSVQAEVRMSAGLALKNSLAENPQKSPPGWLTTDQQIKNEIKSSILSLLALDKKNIINVISQLITAIAVIEIPMGEGNDIIEALAQKVTERQYNTSSTKQAALKTIGFICESLSPQVLTTNQKNAILTAIIDGSRREQLDLQVKLAAFQALCNSMEFIRENFENRAERDFIIKVICDGATPHINSTMEVQVAAYECLNRAMQLYYDKMDDYMSSSLFNLTLIGMARTVDHPIVLQTLEFWSTVSDIEIERKKQKLIPMHGFTEASIEYILPTLLKLLIKEPHQAGKDEEEWDVPKSASNCLSSFAVCCKESIVPQLIGFVENNLLSSDDITWNRKEAAIVAFGSIVKGPSKTKIKPLVEQILPTVVLHLSYPNAEVQLAASWTLSQIVKEVIKVLDIDSVFETIMPAINICLFDGNQRVACNACQSIIYAAKNSKSNTSNKSSLDKNTESGPLSKYTKDLVNGLIERSRSFDLREDDLFMNTIYEALSAIVSNCGDDCEPIVEYVVDTMITRLEVLSRAKIETFQGKDITKLQSSLLEVLKRCIYRLSEKISSYADHIFALLMKTVPISQGDNSISKPMSIVMEDTCTLISALITSLGAQFHRYMEVFIPYLSDLIQQASSDAMASQDHRICKISVQIISDLSSALQDSINPYANVFMQLLFNNMDSEILDPDIKPATLSCFGDVACALGPSFLPFANSVMMVLQKAGNIQVDKCNKDSVEYVDAVRVGIIEAFGGILQALGQDASTKGPFLYHVHGMMTFVDSLVMSTTRSDELNKAILGLIGDIAEIYGDQIKKSLMEKALHDLLIGNLKGNIYFSKRTKETAEWALQKVKEVHQN